MRKFRNIACAVMAAAFVAASATACNHNSSPNPTTVTYREAYPGQPRPCGPNTEPLPAGESSNFVCQNGYWLPREDDLGN